MGSGSNYKADGGFEKYEWKAEDEKIAGIKILHNPNSTRPNDLPAYSDTSDAYFKRIDSGEITQLRIYEKRTAKLDIDINPSESHRNKDGTVFPAGVVHVQEFRINKKGKLVRGNKARYLTDDEIKTWGNAIIEANPNAKFRP